MGKLAICGVGAAGIRAALNFSTAENGEVQRLLLHDEGEALPLDALSAGNTTIRVALSDYAVPDSFLDVVPRVFHNAQLVVLLAALEENVAARWAPTISLMASGFAPAVAQLRLPSRSVQQSVQKRAMEACVRVSMSCQMIATINPDAVHGLGKPHEQWAWWEPAMAALSEARVPAPQTA